jgi:hypothetical protein
MIEVKEQCKCCYHFQVCANILKQQLFIRGILGEENPICEQFIPTDNVVAVVRCKDCKHYGGVAYGFVCRKYSGADTKVCTEKDHYCSYGERREENEG